MGCYYLRIEGINLDTFVYDTNDLNAVRGGGLLMLRLIDRVERFLESRRDISVEKITNGASWGLYNLATDHGFEPADLLGKINSHLNGLQITCVILSQKTGKKKTISMMPWHHATRAVDIVEAGDPKKDFRTDREKAQALNRWRQMQSLSLTLPAPEEFKKDLKKTVCDFDLVSPAYKYLAKEKKAVSRSVSDRRLYGKHQKQQFYYEETKMKEINEQEFVEDLTQLTELAVNKRDSEAANNLAGKMAVIYMDGNSFGKTQRDHCLTPDDQRAFNNTVIENHRSFLSKILQTILNANAPLWYNDGRIRFETLLWGGDEIMLVVPAWQGWEVLGRFYQMAKNWNYKNRPLTYAAGLVFCHHNAPIHRIKNLAHDLAELAKEKGKEKGYVAYQILESFDHAGLELADFRALRSPAGIVAAELIIQGELMPVMNKAMQTLKEQTDFSKRKLYQIVSALHMGDLNRTEELADKAGFNSPDMQDVMNNFGSQPSCWLHILELWDFLGREDV